MILSGCKKTYTIYQYGGRVLKENITSFPKDFSKKIFASGILIDRNYEKSYVDYFSCNVENGRIISSTIKIIDNEKEYTIKNEGFKNFIYRKEIKINSDSFIVKFGKVKLNNGKILELPPIKFIKRVREIKVNPVLDALNQDTREDPFQGTIEEYREWKKRNK